MRTKTYLKDYQPPSHLIPEVHLEVWLDAEETKVCSTLRVEPNGSSRELRLDGVGLQLLSATIDGLPVENYTLTEDALLLQVPAKPFTLKIESSCSPVNNDSLEGLYQSGGILCTQMEPEGFRRFAYFLDRPDVLSRYTTILHADRSLYPALLCNGNPQDETESSITWVDPFKKPPYLFAIVAGDLGSIHDTHKTPSGREIRLSVYCDRGNEERSRHALDSLKKSMIWDEKRFRLECDLEQYSIVVVDAFNMGAMENKGLNIFNNSCALADPETATDANFHRVEQVVAHEYFHNWTGNRVTVRDWFQLTLKEGLTVFRDQEFTADHHSRAVKRIEDVIELRSRQFPEDAGPNAHPIQPTSYLAINNFYTPTIYEKGAEVIRMLHTLLGEETFQKGIDLYFARYDGQAIRTNEWISAMEGASGRDLSQFSLWYSQKGTPVVHVKKEGDALHLRQERPDGETNPLLIPFKVAMIGETAGEEQLIELDTWEKRVPIGEGGVPSLNRGFSAPVELAYTYSDEELLTLSLRDSDLFNRWEAAQRLARNWITEGKNPKGAFLDSYRGIFQDLSGDLSFLAHFLTLPSLQVLIGAQNPLDLDQLIKTREQWVETIGQELRKEFSAIYEVLHRKTEPSFTEENMGRRALKNRCLQYLFEADPVQFAPLAHEQYKSASTMTDRFAALAILCHKESEEREEVLGDFWERWQKDSLVVPKWLSAQASSHAADTLSRVEELIGHPAYSRKTPNLVRGLISTFSLNLPAFHDPSGKGYQIVAGEIAKIDAFNPLIAAGLCKFFALFSKLDPARQERMREVLTPLLESPDLSKNSYEVLTNTLHVT